MEYKVSVIVPVYNAEQYLARCLGNLLNQTLAEIEVILVNDCSTDRSLQIMQAAQQQFPEKVKIIDLKENRGPGNARNLGIESAKGEYIGLWTVMIVSMFICMRNYIWKQKSRTVISLTADSILKRNSRHICTHQMNCVAH